MTAAPFQSRMRFFSSEKTRLHKPFFLSFLVGSILLAVSSVHALGVYEWRGNVSNQWSNANNWFPAVVPGPSDYAVFADTHSHPCLINVNATLDTLYTNPGYTGT